MSKTTLKDIAKKLNVSISTVSKALSDSYEISKETKELIQKYAEEHNFTPNKLARSLKIGKTNTLGVVVSNISNSFVSQIMDGIQIASQASAYDIIIMQSRDDEKLEKNCIEVLKMRGIDGLLIAPVSFNSNFNELQSLQEDNTPVVIFDRIKHKLDCYKVGVNNYDGTFFATKHLIENGRQNILHITAKNLGVAEERLNGFKDCLIKYNINFNAKQYLECNLNNVEELDNKIREKVISLRKENAIDAIFGATDVITTRTLGVLAELEIEVPKEIAVIGFSNIQIANSLNPSLSTIVQPAKEIGITAVEKLLKIISSKIKTADFLTLELDTSLIIRKSSV